MHKEWKKDRFQAIKKAWWKQTPVSEQDQEFASLHDCLVDVFGTKPTIYQIQTLFMLLPEGLVGNALLWSFREALHEFVIKNIEQIKNVCGVSP